LQAVAAALAEVAEVGRWLSSGAAAGLTPGASTGHTTDAPLVAGTAGPDAPSLPGGATFAHVTAAAEHHEGGGVARVQGFLALAPASGERDERGQSQQPPTPRNAGVGPLVDQPIKARA